MTLTGVVASEAVGPTPEFSLDTPSSLVAHVCQFWSGVGPGPVVVAVSGGPDSVALLRALAAAGVGPLVVAHLNHLLRGADSDADEAFVQQQTATLSAGSVTSVECRCRRLDVAGLARAEKDNLESTARHVRYEWLAEVARTCRAPWVATGHTADDQAETVLFRLLRGTGLRGLRGIAARRELVPGVQAVRPLLGVTRDEVLAYLKELGQPYRLDPSNADLRLARNRIRHELLPLLTKHYNQAAVPILCRLAAQAEETFNDLEQRAGHLLAETELPRAGPVLVFDRQKLVAEPRFLVRELFRLVWQREGWSMDAMDFHAWDRLAAVCHGEVVAVDLPQRIHVQWRNGVVQLSRSPTCGE